MSRIGLVAALALEARCLGALGRAGSMVVQVSGPGPARARAAAEAAVEAGVSGLISWGLAAGLDPELPPGRVVLATTVIDSGGDEVVAASDWRLAVAGALSPSMAVTTGRMLQVDAPILEVAAKSRLWDSWRALAADMESAAIGQVAKELGVPFLVVRVIVDAAADAVPPAAVIALAGSGIAWPRVLAALLKSPAEIPALARLAGNAAKARASLRRVADLAAGALVRAD